MVPPITNKFHELDRSVSVWENVLKEGLPITRAIIQLKAFDITEELIHMEFFEIAILNEKEPQPMVYHISCILFTGK